MVGGARTIEQLDTTGVLLSKRSSRSIDQQPFSSRPFHSLTPKLAEPSEAQTSAPLCVDGLRLHRRRVKFYTPSAGGACSCSTTGLRSCSTTSSLTCSRPTSSSSMLRRPILPRFTASARMAKAPIATAPAALAPTASAPRPVHASPVATRANATCAPKEDCSFRPALCIFFIVLSFLPPRRTGGKARKVPIPSGDPWAAHP